MPATGTTILNEQTESRDAASFAAGVLILFVRLYQVTLGPLLGGQCRFQPTCSHYAIESLRMHGAVRGSWLTILRLLRCHPFGGSGFDPVPRSDSPCHSSNEECSR